MSDTTAKVTCQQILVDLPGEPRYLLVSVTVDCPLCGPHAWRVAGHHLRSLRNFLIETIDTYPDLCGPEPTTPVRERFEGRANDPTTS